MTGTVWLLGYPVALGMSLVEHVEDWAREFRLVGLGRESGAAQADQDVPERLQAMVAHLTASYRGELSRPDRLRARAAALGQERVDLPYPARPETPDVVRGWHQMLLEVDAYCAAEGLLTLQRSPAQVALQEWVTEEFLRQVEGLPPRPWTGPLTR